MVRKRQILRGRRKSSSLSSSFSSESSLRIATVHYELARKQIKFGNSLMVGTQSRTILAKAIWVFKSAIGAVARDWHVCAIIYISRLLCVCNHLLAANFHSSRSLKHWWPMAMATHRGKLNMNVEKWGHCHIFGEEIIPTCRFLLHLLLDRLKNYSERSLGQRMNKTAKYISVRQSGRNAIITLGLGENRKRKLRLETFLLAILQKLYWGQQPLLTMANPRLLT